MHLLHEGSRILLWDVQNDGGEHVVDIERERRDDQEADIEGRFKIISDEAYRWYLFVGLFVETHHRKVAPRGEEGFWKGHNVDNRRHNKIVIRLCFQSSIWANNAHVRYDLVCELWRKGREMLSLSECVLQYQAKSPGMLRFNLFFLPSQCDSDKITPFWMWFGRRSEFC